MAGLAAILSQIKATDIIKEHLRYSLHRDTPISCGVSWKAGQHELVVGHFEAVVSADSRQSGAFRWPADDAWVRVIKSCFAIACDELDDRGEATGKILQLVHCCGIDMREKSREWPDSEDVDEGED